MNVEFPTHHFLQSVKFSTYDQDTIKRITVKAIWNPTLLDAEERPVEGGLYDPALGPYSKSDRCATCNMNYFHCPGHFGHIELSVPLFNPLLFNTLLKLYRITCIYCNRLRYSSLKIAIWKAKLQLLNHDLLVEALTDIDQLVSLWTENKSNSMTEEPSSLSDRLNQYVTEKINEIRPLSTHYSSSLIATKRKELIYGEILAKPLSQQCEQCNKFNPRIKVTNGRLFEVPLSTRHSTTNIVPPNNLKRPLSDSESDSNSGSDSDSEPDGENSNHKNTTTLGSSDEVPSKSPCSLKYITPTYLMGHLKNLWDNNANLLNLVFPCSNPSDQQSQLGYLQFFIEYIPVPPTRFRPPSLLNGRVYENPQNSYLTAIIKASDQILTIRQEVQDNEGTQNTKIEAFRRIITAWITLQEQLNYFYDSSKLNVKGGKLAPPGIKQILEKKEGLFRKHMMGKRVNYAARSVISPDVMIETSEIGLPLIFASKLTYPEPVTAQNLLRLHQAVINGPWVHPGATMIQDENGVISNLSMLSVEARTALANRLLSTKSQENLTHTSGVNKRVWRHVLDGDVLLLNRQPTLHKPSIMAHRCRVLKGEKTIRLHYVNCNTYNADFDGDEMNVHFPQSELGRAEAYLIANTDSQYLVPTDGSPLRGLIQDHIGAAVLLTMKDMFLEREFYTQLLANSLPGGIIRLQPPCVIRPKPMWSGKQLFSTLLDNLIYGCGYGPLNIISQSKTPARLLNGQVGHEESIVLIHNSMLLSGIIDKAQIGDSSYGLIHYIYELYGGPLAGSVLSALSRLLTLFLQWRGFTCGMEDIVLLPAAELTRLSAIIDLKHQDPIDVQPLWFGDNDSLQKLDNIIKTRLGKHTSSIINASLEGGLFRTFPFNNMTLMTMSGAKGSLVNASQISGALGQQELEGRRVPLMPSSKTLPCMAPWDLGPRAGGYISQRFLSGICPPEFYFHCMAGREGLIDTAVKTSRSGYLQRCLVKHLESLRVHYDGTVRDIDGTIVQFIYGEDGIDVIKSLSLSHFKMMSTNMSILLVKWRPGEVLQHLDTRSVKRWKRKSEHRSKEANPMAITELSPWISLGAVSEYFSTTLEAWLASPEWQSTSSFSSVRLSIEQFRILMWLHYMRSLVEPGEMVGILAAQSIGEPSTQMTLNTFHLAGFGAKNVTLGIPRLREIIMVASKKIKTPTMLIPLRHDCSRTTAQALAAAATRYTLACCVHPSHAPIRLEETIRNSKQGRRRSYVIQLFFLPGSQLKSEPFYINEEEMLIALKERFSSLLLEYINKQFKKVRVRAPLIEKSSSNDVLAHRTSSGIEDQIVASETHRKDAYSLDQDDSSEEKSFDSENEGATTLAATIDYGDTSQTENSTDNSSDSEGRGNDGEDDDDNEDDDDEEEEDDDDDYVSKKNTQSTTTSISALAAAIKNRKNKRSQLENTKNGLESFHYDFDSGIASFVLDFSVLAPKLFLIPILERILPKVIIREIPYIGKAFLDEHNEKILLSTEGVNFTGLIALDRLYGNEERIVEMNALYSNDIFAVLEMYGVEAARSVIVKEISTVFGAYGISIDHRHLTLIADYMTFEGGYRPMNRTGLVSSTSPLLKMTFESTFEYLKQAALFGEEDNLTGPSARLTMGQVPDIGTGCMDIVQLI